MGLNKWFRLYYHTLIKDGVWAVSISDKMADEIIGERPE